MAGEPEIITCRYCKRWTWADGKYLRWQGPLYRPWGVLSELGECVLCRRKPPLTWHDVQSGKVRSLQAYVRFYSKPRILRTYIEMKE